MGLNPTSTRITGLNPTSTHTMGLNALGTLTTGLNPKDLYYRTESLRDLYTLGLIIPSRLEIWNEILMVLIHYGTEVLVFEINTMETNPIEICIMGPNFRTRTETESHCNSHYRTHTMGLTTCLDSFESHTMRLNPIMTHYKSKFH